MNIAIVGTGFVADYYMTTLRNYPELTLRGAMTTLPRRLKVCARHYSVSAWEFQGSPRRSGRRDRRQLQCIQRCLNLPCSAFGGKARLFRKPLAMNYDDAEALVAFARKARTPFAAARPMASAMPIVW